MTGSLVNVPAVKQRESMLLQFGKSEFNLQSLEFCQIQVNV